MTTKKTDSIQFLVTNDLAPQQVNNNPVPLVIEKLWLDVDNGSYANVGPIAAKASVSATLDVDASGGDHLTVTFFLSNGQLFGTHNQQGIYVNKGKKYLANNPSGDVSVIIKSDDDITETGRGVVVVTSQDPEHTHTHNIEFLRRG